MTLIAILAGLPLLLLIVGLPIYLVLLTTASAAILTQMSVPATMVPQIMFGGLDKFALLSVPFFIFAGEIMSRGGVSRRWSCVRRILG